MIGYRPCKDLYIFRFHLLIALQPGIYVYLRKGLLIGVGGEAFGTVGNRYFNRLDQAVSVGEPHGDGCAVAGGNGNGHILQRKSGIAGIGMDPYVSCRWQSDPSFWILKYSMRKGVKKCGRVSIRLCRLQEGLHLTDIGCLAVEKLLGQDIDLIVLISELV